VKEKPQGGPRTPREVHREAAGSDRREEDWIRIGSQVKNVIKPNPSPNPWL
jgi:hypothetical protein